MNDEWNDKQNDKRSGKVNDDRNDQENDEPNDRGDNEEFTAITEIEPARENSRHQFMVKLFDEQRIAVVPLNRVERFAEDLRARLQ